MIIQAEIRIRIAWGLTDSVEKEVVSDPTKRAGRSLEKRNIVKTLQARKNTGIPPNLHLGGLYEGTPNRSPDLQAKSYSPRLPTQLIGQ